MRRFLSQPFDQAAPIWAIWLGLTARSIGLAVLEARFDGSGMPFSVSSRPVSR